MAILEMRKDLNAEQRKDKLESLVQEFHIAHIRSNKGMSLSGGERQLVALENIEEGGLFKRLFDQVQRFFSNLISNFTD